jgi:hypothetical protein
VRERDDADVDGVETMRDEACIEFARLRNTSWMNARTSVANIRHTKVGTTMNRCKKRRAFSHCFFSSSRHEEEEGTFLPVAHYCSGCPGEGRDGSQHGVMVWSESAGYWGRCLAGALSIVRHHPLSSLPSSRRRCMLCMRYGSCCG